MVRPNSVSRNLLAFLCTLLSSVAQGQELTCKGCSISIPPAATLTIKGDVQLASGATFSNNGTVQVSGDWGHDGTLLYTGTGTLEMNGNGAQSLTATTLYNLLFSGAGQTTATGAFTVTNNLAFTSGTLVTTEANPVTLGPMGTLSETAAAFINGWIQSTRTVAQGASNDFGGLGLTLTAQGGSPGVTTVLRGTGATAVQTGSTHSSIARVYTVIAANNTGLQADVLFAYRDGELNSLDESSLILFGSQDGGSTWGWLGQVGRDAGSNTVTMTGIHSFGRLTLGSSAAPLPVTWLSFSGLTRASGNELQWSTAAEVNTASFEVERSATGSNFARIGWVEAAGNSTADQHYRFSDPAIGSIFYYRLKQVDRDGRFSYSSVIRLLRGEETQARSAVVYPNPFAEKTLLRLSRPFSTDTKMKLMLLDAAGSKVFQQDVLLAAGQADLPIHALSGWPRGTYFLSCTIATGEKFLVALQHLE